MTEILLSVTIVIFTTGHVALAGIYNHLPLLPSLYLTAHEVRVPPPDWLVNNLAFRCSVELLHQIASFCSEVGYPLFRRITGSPAQRNEGILHLVETDHYSDTSVWLEVAHFRNNKKDAFCLWTDNSPVFLLEVPDNIFILKVPKDVSIVQRAHNKHPSGTALLHLCWYFLGDHEMPLCSTQRLCKFWPHWFLTGSHFLVRAAGGFDGPLSFVSPMSQQSQLRFLSFVLNELSAG